MNWGELKKYAEDEGIPDDAEVIIDYPDGKLETTAWRRQGGASKEYPIVAILLLNRKSH